MLSLSTGEGFVERHPTTEVSSGHSMAALVEKEVATHAEVDAVSDLETFRLGDLYKDLCD
jgi:hypothetical protein